jgi:hypothetical protein
MSIEKVQIVIRALHSSLPTISHANRWGKSSSTKPHVKARPKGWCRTTVSFTSFTSFLSIPFHPYILTATLLVRALQLDLLYQPQPLHLHTCITSSHSAPQSQKLHLNRTHGLPTLLQRIHLPEALHHGHSLPHLRRQTNRRRRIRQTHPPTQNNKPLRTSRRRSNKSQPDTRHHGRQRASLRDR